MYSKEILKKVTEQLDERMNFYRSIDSAKYSVCVSVGNKKIGRVLNVSLAPIRTCANCSECCKYCYDIKACLQYPNVRDARARNTVKALFHTSEYFAEIRRKIARRKRNKFFRWHVSGDIPNLAYFAEMVKIAEENPTWIFWTYTKAYHIINEYCRRYGAEAVPSNLTVMFSEWDGMPLVNPYHFPIFSVKLKDGNKNRSADSFASMYLCPGNCDICKEARRGCLNNEDTYVNEH